MTKRYPIQDYLDDRIAAAIEATDEPLRSELRREDAAGRVVVVDGGSAFLIYVGGHALLKQDKLALRLADGRPSAN